MIGFGKEIVYPYPLPLTLFWGPTALPLKVGKSPRTRDERETRPSSRINFAKNAGKVAINGDTYG